MAVVAVLEIHIDRNMDGKVIKPFSLFVDDDKLVRLSPARFYTLA
jgi:hypothetical protein